MRFFRFFRFLLFLLFFLALLSLLSLLTLLPQLTLLTLLALLTLLTTVRAGIIKNYTGVSAPYEEPENPDLVIDTEVMEVEEAVEKVLEFLRGKGGMLEV